MLVKFALACFRVLLSWKSGIIVLKINSHNRTWGIFCFIMWEGVDLTNNIGMECILELMGS